MRRIQSSEAKAKFAELLDEVERGETVVVTRHGKAVARIVPEGEARRAAVLAAKRGIEELRKDMPNFTLEEILSARHEGHKY